MDKALEQYATPLQWEAYTSYMEHGSMAAAGRELKKDPRGLDRQIAALLAKAAAKGYAPEQGLNHPLPPGQGLKGVSTLYDGDGKMRAQWVKTTKDDVERMEAWKTVIDELKSDVESLPRLSDPQISDADLLVGYPVGDHHLGMLSWAKETGESYDLKIGEKLLDSAVSQLVGSSPAANNALVVFLGDFMHYDSTVPVTSQNSNVLDADGRHPKMIRTAIRSMRRTIETVANKHKFVKVIIEIGNHDLYSSIFLQETMRVLYENSPRVKIDTSCAHYHMHEFGNNLIATHHGHGPKPAQLPGIMATDWKEAWGRTSHRAWWTGHVHHQRAQEFPGCIVESFRVLPPKDAWHHQKGYRSGQDMKAITLHVEYGEVARATVNPEMFR